jgi:hypothetical protein
LDAKPITAGGNSLGRARSFFATDTDFAAFQARRARERTRRARLMPRPHVRALATFARALARMRPADRQAAIRYLLRRFPDVDGEPQAAR